MLGTQIPVMPDIVRKIRLLAFKLTDDDDLTTVLHQFTLPYEMAERYLIIQQGLGAPMLSKAAEFARPTQTKLPHMLMEATISYSNFHVALHILLGDEHPVTWAYDLFWSDGMPVKLTS